jgi:hypothetical protein
VQNISLTQSLLKNLTITALITYKMLVSKTFHDLPTKLDPAGRPIRIFVISPNVPNYAQAKFPGLQLMNA